MGALTIIRESSRSGAGSEIGRTNNKKPKVTTTPEEMIARLKLPGGG